MRTIFIATALFAITAQPCTTPSTDEPWACECVSTSVEDGQTITEWWGAEACAPDAATAEDLICTGLEQCSCTCDPDPAGSACG